MSESRDLRRRLAEFYAGEAPSRAPDWVLRESLAAIETTKQRHVVVGAPRRFYLMSTNFKLAAAVVAAIALGAAGLRLLTAPAGPGGGPTSTPTVTASPSPTPVVAPTASPQPSAPPLTGTYTSELFGLTVSYPAGWTVTKATKPWAPGPVANFGGDASSADLILGQQMDLFMMVTSQPLNGASGSAWADALAAQPDPGPCPTSEAVVVAGLDGRLYSCSEPIRALFWSADRGYFISIYRSGDVAGAEDIYDTAWFKGVLATVKLP
jgi:hypothetical protein